MKEINITKDELEYYSNPQIGNAVNEPSPLYNKLKLSFEEESKDCITLEEFGKRWKEAINNDPRFT